MHTQNTRNRLLSQWLVNSIRFAQRFNDKPGVNTLMRLSRLLGGGFAETKIGPFHVLLDTTDRFQSHMLLDAYEPETDELFSKILREGDVYVDVGAQVGYTAAFAAKHIGPSGHMVLFEPDPRAWERLQQTIASSPAQRSPGITAKNNACSNAAGEVTLNILPTLGHSQIGGGDFASREARPVQVHSVTLDDSLTQLGVTAIRLLKVDVEGHEIEVFEGASALLAQKRVDFVWVEKNAYLLEQRGLTVQHLHAMLARHGYIAMFTHGEYVNSDNMEVRELENLLYAATPELARLVSHAPPPEKLHLNDQLETLFQESVSANSPVVLAKRLISSVRNGKPLSDAIAEGEQLLEKHSELQWLRGHVAHWHYVAGDLPHARRCYEALVADSPNDAEAAKRLEELTARVA